MALRNIILNYYNFNRELIYVGYFRMRAVGKDQEYCNVLTAMTTINISHCDDFIELVS